MSLDCQSILIVGLWLDELKRLELLRRSSSAIKNKLEQIKQEALLKGWVSNNLIKYLDYHYCYIEDDFVIGFTLLQTGSNSFVEIEVQKLKDIETFIIQFENIFEQSPKVMLFTLIGC